MKKIILILLTTMLLPLVTRAQLDMGIAAPDNYPYIMKKCVFEDLYTLFSNSLYFIIALLVLIVWLIFSIRKSNKGGKVNLNKTPDRYLKYLIPIIALLVLSFMTSTLVIGVFLTLIFVYIINFLLQYIIK